MAKAKGFKTGNGPQKTATIRFAEGHALHGIEVEIQLRVPVGVVLGASAANLSQALTPFVQRIERWNLLDADDQPVPVSMEAFGEHFDTEEAMALLAAWIEVTTQPSVPLEERLNGSASLVSG